MKICIVGNVGDNNATCSGQILRTRILRDCLETRYGKDNVVIINTNEYRKNAVNIVFGLVSALFRCQCFIMMLSRNGRRVFYPIMYIYQKLFGKHVFNNVIGGGYTEYLNNNPKQIKYSMGYDVNWVQAQSMMDDLEKMGMQNAEVLPNSKPQTITDKVEQRAAASGGKYVFCTFSRVLREKGIEDAIYAVQEANRIRGRDDVFLNIYGSVEDTYKDRFEHVMKETTPNIQYMGYVAPERTTEVLEECYVLLFPTTWSGEGFPGTVLDGFAAGLPVIATNWSCNAEVIEDGVTGRIYDIEQNEKLKDYILWATDNEKTIDKMRVNCVNEARKYSPENVMPIIYRRIDSLLRR